MAKDNAPQMIIGPWDEYAYGIWYRSAIDDDGRMVEYIVTIRSNPKPLIHRSDTEWDRYTISYLWHPWTEDRYKRFVEAIVAANDTMKNHPEAVIVNEATWQKMMLLR